MNPMNFPYRKEIRQNEAKERQTAYDALTSKEKLALLDRRFGANVGAAKQRLRLQRQMTEVVKEKVQVETVLPEELSSKSEDLPKEKKNARRSKKSKS